MQIDVILGLNLLNRVCGFIYYLLSLPLHSISACELCQTVASDSFINCYISCLLIIISFYLSQLYPFFADIKALCAVNSELVSVAPRWRDLGVSLGLDSSTLELIDADHPRDASRCLTEVLAKWLQQVRTIPSWRTLVFALTSFLVNRSDLAHGIAMSHGI